MDKMKKLAHGGHGPARYDMPTEEELAALPKSEQDRLEDAARTDKATGIKRLQEVVNTFPWVELGKKKPMLKLDGDIGGATQGAINELIQIGKDFNQPNLLNMERAIANEDYFTARSEAQVAKGLLTNAMHQFMKFPQELVAQYPGLRKWTLQEQYEYMKTNIYPGYFPKPWNLSRFGHRNWDGSFGCDPTKKQCMASYYDQFMSWGPPDNIGTGLMYDPRLIRMMDKYPNIWSQRATKFRMQKNIPSPLIPSPGTGKYMDPENPPEGKRFLDEEDKAWYYKLLGLYNQFKEEEKEKGRHQLPPGAGAEAPKLAKITYDIEKMVEAFSSKIC